MDIDEYSADWDEGYFDHLPFIRCELCEVGPLFWIYDTDGKYKLGSKGKIHICSKRSIKQLRKNLTTIRGGKK